MSDNKFVKVLSANDFSIYYVRATEINLQEFIKITFMYFDTVFNDVYITEEDFEYINALGDNLPMFNPETYFSHIFS